MWKWLKNKIVNWLLKGVVVEELRTKKLVDKGNTLYVDIADFDHNTSDGSPTESQMWYNSTDHVLRYRNDTATVDIGASGDLSMAQDFIIVIDDVSGWLGFYSDWPNPPDWQPALKETMVAHKSGTLDADISSQMRTSNDNYTCIVRTTLNTVQKDSHSTTSESWVSCDVSFEDSGIVKDTTYTIQVELRGNGYMTWYRTYTNWVWDFGLA